MVREGRKLRHLCFRTSFEADDCCPSVTGANNATSHKTGFSSPAVHRVGRHQTPAPSVSRNNRKVSYARTGASLRGSRATRILLSPWSWLAPCLDRRNRRTHLQNRRPNFAPCEISAGPLRRHKQHPSDNRHMIAGPHLDDEPCEKRGFVWPREKCERRMKIHGPHCRASVVSQRCCDLTADMTLV